jgi:hypothetical protein
MDFAFKLVGVSDVLQIGIINGGFEIDVGNEPIKYQFESDPDLDVNCEDMLIIGSHGDRTYVMGKECSFDSKGVLENGVKFAHELLHEMVHVIHM